MKLKVSEKEIQNTILDYLNYRGHFCWRQNSGAVISEYKGKKRFFRFGVKGAADITGISKDGKRLDIEVKAGYNKPTMDQLFHLDSLGKRGGLAFVAYCLDDVIKRGL